MGPKTGCENVVDFAQKETFRRCGIVAAASRSVRAALGTCSSYAFLPRVATSISSLWWQGVLHVSG
jgi:hypothetical protein